MVKINKLTHKELLRQVDYDHLTGLFYRKVSNTPCVKVGDVAGYKNKKGYIEITINSKVYRAHRLAWFHYYGYMPENDIDHWDQIKHHNWIINLREVSQQCNQRNTGNRQDNTSGVKGAGWDKHANKWKAQIMINNKNKHLGLYKEFHNAVCARLAGEQCVNWEGCDSNSPAYLYVKEHIQNE